MYILSTTPTYEQTKKQHSDTNLVAMESQSKMRERRDYPLQDLGKGRNATPSHSEEYKTSKLQI